MRLGIIGAGLIAARHIAALAEADPDVYPVAFLSRSVEKAAQAARSFGGEAFDTVQAFIRQGRPDAVIVTVPPSQHGPIELALAEAGIPFLVEKPIGLDDAIPDRIADTLSRRNLVAAVGYNWRALDTLAAVRRQIEQTPIRMVIGRFHIGTPLTPWWRFEAHSGGQMLEQACHLIDLSRYLAGAGQLLAAAGTRGALPGVPDGDVAGTSAALFLFGGVPGVITAACVLPNGPGAELRLICEGCEIAIGLAGVTIVRGRESSHTASGTSSYALQDRAFFDAVRRNRPDVVLCPYDDALATHRLALAAARQIRQN
ncbi:MULTISPECIES: Gfo/Idh/MocA family oxidoreductase [unclassified Devosia]|uniref:Gfo/Idh/MocA family protein n=1 Tax=unclassified Devosia TaxID=196773 RepID=UPI001AC75D08|nr:MULTISPECIES: Gfo/Idh/MocA family oxidoreductase [unclassified Devosia]MBN9306742.1 Gfo/Idh/MocA family oxidoreductase [Devosia sp.]